MGIISINNGYHSTKVVMEDRRYTFESKVTKQIDEYAKGVVVDGISYKVGEGSSDIDLNKSTNVVQLACIGNALNKSGLTEANIITALPVNLYINKLARQEYTEKIKMLEVTTKINDVKIYMEGAAAQLADAAWYKNKVVVLLDIGGLTINMMVFEDGKLVAGTQDSVNLGTIILDNKIRTALARNGYDNYTDYQIPYLFKSEDPLTSRVVATTIEEHLEEISQALKKKGYPTKIEHRATGGGALRLRTSLEDRFKSYIGDFALWENAIGQYVLGKKVWG